MSIVKQTELGEKMDEQYFDIKQEKEVDIIVWENGDMQIGQGYNGYISLDKEGVKDLLKILQKVVNEVNP
jgi:hypothetical protein